MKYEILIEPDHVLGIAEGDFLFDVACVFIEKALRSAEETNLSKLLADVRKLNGSISTMERYDIGIIFSKLVSSIDNNALISIAILGHEPIVAPNRLTETAATS